MGVTRAIPYHKQVPEITAMGGPAPRQGETKDQYQVRVENWARGGAATPPVVMTAAAGTGLGVGGPPPSQGSVTTMSVQTGTPAAAAGHTGVGLPAGLAGILSSIGIGAPLIAGLGALYVGSQAVGVQYPWETGPGEGFISPFSRDIVKDENGRWVTRATRPDLFGANGSTALMAPGAAGLGATGVAKVWQANGWPFAMTTDGRIHTVTKNGVRKSWRPYRSVVLGKKMSAGMAKRAVRKLQSIKKLANDIERLGGTRTVYRNK